MGMGGFTKDEDLTDHVQKDPKAVHGLWEMVLKHGPRIYISDVAPTADDGVEGDVWLEH